MGTYKMPTVHQFLRKKKMYDPKKDPVWVYLEREMREKAEVKPYNEKVGEWLKFLKDFSAYKNREAKKAKQRLEKEMGPLWYSELSSSQRQVLSRLRENIHQDLIEDIPSRTRKALSDLGVTARIPKKILMETMTESVEDPGVFIWKLYTALYKSPPSTLKEYYDMNAIILMSSLVFIDLEECVDELDKLTANSEKASPPPKKPQKRNVTPKCRYGEYLQTMHVPEYFGAAVKAPRKPPPITYKFRLRSELSMENICNDKDFLDARIERNKKEKQKERICNYKFWEPPTTLRNTDPKMAAYAEKLKMFKKKAKQKYTSPYNNTQYTVAGVAYTGGKPNYILQCVSILHTGYIPIHGGDVLVSNQTAVPNIHGYWKYPQLKREKCEVKCDCLVKWGPDIISYLQTSHCMCGHFYDFNNEGVPTEKYFYPPTKHGALWFDEAKVYQMDPTEDFIKDTVAEAVRSKDPTPAESEPTLSAAGLKEKELLGAFLADLNKKPIMIPHLPQANLLSNLQAWVRKRVHGALDPNIHKAMSLKSLRRWIELHHMDFRAIAYMIPFTQKQLKNFNWSHRQLVQKLFNILQTDFVNRNRLKQLEQTRLWWSTMKYDTYPGKPFLDIFFTYMPGRMKDTYLIDPYSSVLIPKSGGKTCPLN